MVGMIPEVGEECSKFVYVGSNWLMVQLLWELLVHHLVGVVKGSLLLGCSIGPKSLQW